MDDEILVAKARKGDLTAFNTLVERHQQQAYNVARRLTNDDELAADVTQEAFLKAYLHLDQFKAGCFRSWLLRIVTNTAIDQIRRRKVRDAISLDSLMNARDGDLPLPARSPDPERAAMQSELRAWLVEAVDQLPTKLRSVLILADVHGLSYPEVAEIVGIPVGTVKSRLSRARSAVRDRLAAMSSSRSAPQGPRLYQALAIP